MKNFKNFISETPSWNNVGDKEYGDSSFANPQTIQRINAIMGHSLKEDQLDSAAAIARVRTNLSKLGLTFDAVSFTEDNGTVELPLTLYGGRFGKDGETPHDQFIKDDGLSHIIEGGLKLVITYEKTEHNACRMRAKIV